MRNCFWLIVLGGIFLAACGTSLPVSPAVLPTASPTTPSTVPPAISSDQAHKPLRKIAFTSFRDGHPEIYVMNSDGSLPVRLTRDPEGNYAPGWSPNGHFIYFHSKRDGDDEIYVMNADGTGQRRITQLKASIFALSWSHDSAKIAFITSAGEFDSKIYTARIDGSAVRCLSIGENYDTSPTWAPNGNNIAFISKRDGSPETYIMREDGSDQRRLTRNQLSENSLIWSPDGKRIAFSAEGAVYVTNADGMGLTQITNDQYDAYPLAWLSAAEIVVAKYTGNQTRGIYAVTVEGAHERFLTNVSSDMPASLSPDGQQIVYVSNLVIHVVNIDGSGRKALTEPGEMNTAPAWQP